MKKELTILTVFGLSCLIPVAASAQSPWETGSYQSYDKPPAGTPAPSGLEGAFGTPSTEPQTQTTPQATGPIAPVAPTVTPATAPAVPRASRGTGTASSGGNYTAPAGDASKVSQMRDTVFIKRSSQLLATILQAADLAKDRGSSDIRRQAKETSSNLKPISDKLATFIQKPGNTSRPGTDTLSRNRVGGLQAANGSDFDAKYISLIRAETSELLHSFTEEASGGTRADLKALASQSLSTIQQQSDQLGRAGISSPAR